MKHDPVKYVFFLYENEQKLQSVIKNSCYYEFNICSSFSYIVCLCWNDWFGLLRFILLGKKLLDSEFNYL